MSIPYPADLFERLRAEDILTDAQLGELRADKNWRSFPAEEIHADSSENSGLILYALGSAASLIAKTLAPGEAEKKLSDMGKILCDAPYVKEKLFADRAALNTEAFGHAFFNMEEHLKGIDVNLAERIKNLWRLIGESVPISLFQDKTPENLLVAKQLIAAIRLQKWRPFGREVKIDSLERLSASHRWASVSVSKLAFEAKQIESIDPEWMLYFLKRSPVIRLCRNFKLLGLDLILSRVVAIAGIYDSARRLGFIEVNGSYYSSLKDALIYRGSVFRGNTLGHESAHLDDHDPEEQGMKYHSNARVFQMAVDYDARLHRKGLGVFLRNEMKVLSWGYAQAKHWKETYARAYEHIIAGQNETISPILCSYIREVSAYRRDVLESNLPAKEKNEKVSILKALLSSDEASLFGPEARDYINQRMAEISQLKDNSEERTILVAEVEAVVTASFKGIKDRVETLYAARHLDRKVAGERSLVSRLSKLCGRHAPLATPSV